MTKTLETQLSKANKLALIEVILVFFYIVLITNIEYGVFYLLFSPGLPLVFAILFLINGLFFEKESNLWKLFFSLNLLLLFLLANIFWFGNAFSNFR